MAIDLRGAVTGDKIAPAAVDGATHIKDGSVQTAKIALSAVTAAVLADNAVTEPKIAAGAVTTAKVPEKVRTRPLASDDTEITNANAADRTIYTEIKALRFVVKNAANVTPDKIVIAAEIKTSNVLHAATLGLFIDAEGAPRVTAASLSLAYELITVSFEVGAGAGAGQLAEGAHTLSVQLKTANAAAVGSQKLIEIYRIIL